MYATPMPGWLLNSRGRLVEERAPLEQEYEPISVEDVDGRLRLLAGRIAAQDPAPSGTEA